MKNNKSGSFREKNCASCGNDDFSWGMMTFGNVDDNSHKVFFREFGTSYEDGDMPISVRRCNNCKRAILFINES